MDSIFENPLARMYGPAFVLVYILLYVLAAVYLFFVAPKRAGKIDDDEPGTLPAKPDVYELAYLRGSEIEVVALVIYTLLKRNYILLGNKKEGFTLKKNRAHPEINALNIIEKDAFQKLDEETLISRFSKNLVKDPSFKKHCDSLSNKLEKNRLVCDDDEIKKYNKTKWIIIISLIVLGLYKWAAATAHGHSNVAFLFMLGIAGTTILSNIKVNMLRTSRGEKLLEKFREVFKPVVGDSLFKQPIFFQQLLLAIHSFSLLDYTSFKNFYPYVTGEIAEKKAVYWDNSSSAGSCGSGCSGGCGGGCGGGGCGGCS